MGSGIIRAARVGLSPNGSPKTVVILLRKKSPPNEITDSILMFRHYLCYLILAASFGAAMYGDDITIPLEGGSIEIQNTQLQMDRDAVAAPALSFTPEPYLVSLDEISTAIRDRCSLQ